MFWLHCLSMLAIIQETGGKVAMSSVSQLMDPCLFPLPNSPSFQAICQVNYHEVPWLCDPTGILSRTETEILELKFNTKTNITSCFCDKIDCYDPQKVKVQLIMIPYSSVASIDSCVSSNPFSARLGLSNSKTYTTTSAAIAYAREVGRRWQTQCQADIMLVYIQKWKPDNLSKPLIVTLFQNNLSHLSHLPEVIATTPDSSAFDSILSRFASAVDLIKVHSTVQNHVRRDLENEDFWSSKLCGIPYWAYAVVFVLLVLVIATVYVGNVVTSKMAVEKQMQKKQSVSSMRLANDRWKNGSMSQYAAVPQTRTVKSTNMFRQFSGDNRKKAKQWGPQKI